MKEDAYEEDRRARSQSALFHFKSMKRSRINSRPGEVVCICEKNENVSLWDPGAWWRTTKIKHEKAKKKGDKKDDGD